MQILENYKKLVYSVLAVSALIQNVFADKPNIIVIMADEQ
tara:strand:+ start:230 stop:349 length:120 start_codon:yes stop_codon:yes gene_type:complete